MANFGWVHACRAFTEPANCIVLAGDRMRRNPDIMGWMRGMGGAK